MRSDLNRGTADSVLITDNVVLAKQISNLGQKLKLSRLNQKNLVTRKRINTITSCSQTKVCSPTPTFYSSLAQFPSVGKQQGNMRSKLRRTSSTFSPYSPNPETTPALTSPPDSRTQQTRDLTKERLQVIRISQNIYRQ